MNIFDFHSKLPLAVGFLQFLPAILGAASTLIGSKKSADASKKATEAAKNAGMSPAQIAQLKSDVSNQSIDNARSADALEKELNPLAPQLRTSTMQGLLDANGNPAPMYREQVAPGAFRPETAFGPQGAYSPEQVAQKLDTTGRDALVAQLKASYVGPEFADYSESELTKMAQDEATKQFKLGGKLDMETANQAIRSSAAKAGRTGGGNLGLGRDLSARDLGLTSMALQQKRLDQLGAYGAAKDAWQAQYSGAKTRFGLDAASLQQQDLARRAALGLNISGIDSADREYQNRIYQQNLAQKQYEDSRYRADRSYASSRYDADRADYNQQNLLANNIFNANRDAYTGYNRDKFGNLITAAQFAQGIAKPQVGIDPSTLADIAMANSGLKTTGEMTAAGIAAQGSNGLMQLGGNLLGSAYGGYMGSKANPSSSLYPNTTPAYNPVMNTGGPGYGGYSVKPGTIKW